MWRDAAVNNFRTHIPEGIRWDCELCGNPYYREQLLVMCCSTGHNHNKITSFSPHHHRSTSFLLQLKQQRSYKSQCHYGIERWFEISFSLVRGASFRVGREDVQSSSCSKRRKCYTEKIFLQDFSTCSTPRVRFISATHATFLLQKLLLMAPFLRLLLPSLRLLLTTTMTTVAKLETITSCADYC
jgi:hypothetical protein